MKLTTVAVAFAALLGLCACVTQPLVPYDRSALPQNKIIGLLTPGWPSGPSAVLASDIGQSFGLVGALVDAAMRANREKDLTGILAAHQIDASAIFISTLTNALQGEGYSVVPIPADQKRTDFLKSYPSPGANNVDSYLDIAVLSYGYVAAGMGASVPYRPWMQVKIKLVKASDSSVLMEDFVSYNSLGVIKNVVTISPDPVYSFGAWSDLTGSADQAAKGVSDSVGQTATTLAGLLK